MQQPRLLRPPMMSRITWRTLPSHGVDQIYRGRITWWSDTLVQAIITHTPVDFDFGWHRYLSPAEILCVKPKKLHPVKTKEVITTANKKSKYSIISKTYHDGWAAHEGSFVHLEDNHTGEDYYGKIRLKEVRCGQQGCTRCPHKIYAYAQFRVGRKVTEKYLGVAR